MKNYLKILLYIFAFCLFTFAFVLPEILLGTPAAPAVGNWYQQFLPNIGSQQINDITFFDSLTGFAVASKNVNPDTSSILRTTNGGDNWQIIQTLAPRRLSRIKFVNNLTGFISGGSGSGTPYLYKTIDGGSTWNTVPGATLGTALWGDMAVISEDTIWLTDANSLNGGVFRTTNGGANWQQQINLGSQNPNHIYFYNSRLGFAGKYGTGGIVKRTSNGGVSWSTVDSGGFNGFTDMLFLDTLKGWRVYDFVKNTTNGGLTWNQQTIPYGGNIIGTSIKKLTAIGKDSLLGANGGEILWNNGTQSRDIIYRTTNGGINWQFQIPDTSLTFSGLSSIQFINKSIGWTYTSSILGLHTTTGGDPVWLTGLQQISTEVPKNYELYQNYPNPFNPVTKIKYQIVTNNSIVKLVVYDIQGRTVIELVDQKQNAGTYETDLSGKFLASGVYFYRLTVTTGKVVFIDTKKMMLIK